MPPAREVREETMTVTKVTADATLDDLSAADYMDIYLELRQTTSLDKFIAIIGSTYTKAVWSRYERGDYKLNRQMRDELRSAMPHLFSPLPLTVADAVARNTSPDAAVWMVGDGVAEHVILVAGHESMTLHVNGSVTEVPKVPCNTSNTSAAPRKPIIRPVASIAQDERREALKTTWRAVIEAGLEAMEQK